MIVAGDVNVPDKCPGTCAYKAEAQRMGMESMCMDCPVFCCIAVPDPYHEYGDTGIMYMVDPKDYRHDWALEWKKFFETGEKPRLLLKMEKT